MKHLRAVSLATVLAGVACAGGKSAGPLRPADPAQAAEGTPLAARADAGGVAFVARIGSWRGWPRDLEQRVTPVALVVVNQSRRAVRIAPETFSLAVEGGGRYSPMDQRQVSRAVSDLAGFRSRRPPIRTGGTPGFDEPGDPGIARGPPGVPVPGGGDWQGAFEASGILAPGDTVQTVLYFDVPTSSVRAALLEADVVDESGAKLAELRLPFARQRG